MAIQTSATSMNQGRKNRGVSNKKLKNEKLTEAQMKNIENKKFIDNVYNKQRVPIDSNIIGTQINARTGTWQDDYVTDDEGIRMYEPLSIENRAAQIAFLTEEANAAKTLSVRPIPAELLTSGMDPLLAAAVTSLGLPEGMIPDTSRGQLYSQLGEFAKGMDMDFSRYQAQDAPATEAEALDTQGNIKDGYTFLPENTWEGVTTPARYVKGGQEPESMRLVTEGYAPVNTVDPATGVASRGGLKKVVEGPGIVYNRGEKIRQERQTYEDITAEDTSALILGLQRDAVFLREALNETIASNPELETVFDKWTGEQDGFLNGPLNLGVMLAYDESISKSVYADYSDKEYQEFAEYQEANEGEYDPRLWQSKDNRPFRSPRARSFEESFAPNIEKIFGVPFPSRQDGQIIANAYLQSLQNANIRGVDYNTDTGGSTPRYSPHARVIKEDKDGTINNAYPMEDFWVDAEARAALKWSEGLRQLLAPQLRNHVVFQPQDIDLNKAIAKAGSNIRGQAYAIQNSIPKQLDSALINILKHLYNRDDSWNEYMDGRDIKLKAQHYHILLQEDSYIRNNSPDGKTYYTTKKPRGSGRAGEEELIMADIKVMRAASISANQDTVINLSKELDPNKYNGQEKAFVISLMVHLGYDEKLYEPMIRNFTKFAKEGSEARLIGRALNDLGRLKIVRDINDDGNAEEQAIPDVLQDPARLKASELITDSLDSFQALRALDSFLKAKEKGGVKKFLTKYITSADAAQSGQTIQAFQIGNWQAAMRGGLISGNRDSWISRPDQESRLELEKLYVLATEKAHSDLHSVFKEDEGLHGFAKEMFATGNGVLDFDNLFSKEFAKGAIQGASYGQQVDGSRMAVTQALIDYMNDAPAKEVRERIAKIRERFGDKSILTSLDNPDSHRFEGDALRAVGKLATAFVNGMYHSDTRLLKYSNDMRSGYNTYIRLLELGGRTSQDGKYSLTTTGGGNWKAPHWQYVEPTAAVGQNVYSKKWKGKGNGKTVSMVNNNIPGDWKWFDMRDTQKVWYQEGDPMPDVDNEIRAILKKDPLYRSTGVTRFPVVSIHGLDDLILSVALVEMNRKIKLGHYESLGVKKEDGLSFFMSVWDSGRVPPLLLTPWAKEYNKAFLKTMKENNFLKQLADGFQAMIDDIPEKTYDRIRRNGAMRTEWRVLQNKVNAMQDVANSYYKGNFEKDYKTPKTGVSLTNAAGIGSLITQAEQTGINQMGSPSEVQDKKIEAALKAGMIFDEWRLKGPDELKRINALRRKQ